MVPMGTETRLRVALSQGIASKATNHVERLEEIDQMNRNTVPVRLKGWHSCLTWERVHALDSYDTFLSIHAEQSTAQL
jgi:hypothetical protein